ncbi:MAG: site-2 protease family protein [Candidatus Omnitrophica bacterium]|nr:site-2 protease family protein [Candidatus Omnitrophota bacterium]
MDVFYGFLLLFPLFMVSVMVHEVSHGWVALFLGDPTAWKAGRLTFNPFKHIDPVGTVGLPLFLMLLRAPVVFGWARPVPVNALYFRHPRRDMLWVGAAGPLANYSLAAAAAFMLKFFQEWLPPLAIPLVRYLILVNLLLGTFNLLPIPPLDGSRVLGGLLPAHAARMLALLEKWGIVLVMALLYLGVIDRIMMPVVYHMARFLGVQ